MVYPLAHIPRGIQPIRFYSSRLVTVNPSLSAISVQQFLSLKLTLFLRVSLLSGLFWKSKDAREKEDEIFSHFFFCRIISLQASIRSAE